MNIDQSADSATFSATRRHFILGSGAGLMALGAARAGAVAAPAGGAASVDWRDDPFFGPAVIDIDERRESPAPHRFVHGQFAGTDTRFLVALPDRDSWDGRFIQFLQGGLGGNEYTGYGRGNHGLAFAQGGYYVESNQGHIGNDLSGLKGDNTILNWRASAQAARFARLLAEAHYGRAPSFGYVFGGSGGGMRSIDCIENAPTIWAGAVPFMINRNGLTNFNWSVGAWASAVLAARLPALADAALKGGDTFSVLETDAERAALTTLYNAGYPRRAEDQLGPNPLWILGMQRALAADPRYFLEFWTEPGYAGKDGAPEVAALLLDTEAEVEDVLDGRRVAAELATDTASELSGAMRAAFAGDAPAAIRIRTPDGARQYLGASLVFTSGAASGRRVLCTGLAGGALTASLDVAAFAGVQPGDRLQINNRALLAFMFLHRHAVDRRYPGMRQFFDGDRPRYRQRPADFDAVHLPTGRFAGKMILLQHLLDREALPTSADPYIADVRGHLGDRVDQAFRVWWIDNAQHGVPLDQRNRYIDFRGCYSQALADVIDWVETGQEPPASTPHTLDAGTQVVLPDTAAERRGIQPTVRLMANGKASAQVRIGEPVRLTARIEVPHGAGALESVAFDLDGSGAFATAWPVSGADPTAATAELEHVFTEAGEHVVTVEAASGRAGRHRGYPAVNLARVTVAVTA
ncbi:MAG: hypothetical protein KF911_15660 [Pseudomonadales bacterium]|nr:hypothetical protein [Pseudomonadales bacterium]